MKRLALVGIALALIVAAGCQRRVDIAAETTAVAAVLGDYIASVEREDIDLYGKVMAHDAGMVNYATGGAPIVGWATLEKIIEDQNATLSQTKITASDVSVKISPSGDRAWATSLWDFRAVAGGKSLALPVRCTWILEKRGGHWLVVHFHKSAVCI
jgi:ketosteroid isomerase-like protein